MRRVLFGMVVVWLTCHIAGCKEKTVNPYGSFDWHALDGGALDGGAADVAGGETPTDASADDSRRAVPDGGGPPDVVADTPVDLTADADIPDVPGDLPADADLTGDTGDMGDIGDFEPFTQCDAQTPCPFPQQPLCLLLPASDKGVCVKECQEDSQCPPWQDCIPTDAGVDAMHICATVAQSGAYCDNAAGIVCKAGLYCVLPPDGGEAVCTSFCTPGESICQQGTECKLMDPEDPSWGACLTVDDLPACIAPEECGDKEVCVQLVEGYYRCTPVCMEAGAPCGSFGTCVDLEQPGGETASACLTVQAVGAICSMKKGMPCDDDLKCADVGAPDGWKRCLAPCEEGQCGAGYLCQMPEGAVQELCVPMEFALEAPVYCNDSYPCPAGLVCVQEDGAAGGICAVPCDDGCSEGTACHQDGCVLLSPAGASCLVDLGVFCASGTDCIGDKGNSGAGWCAQPCEPGETVCPDDLACTDALLDQAYCLKGVGHGELCSLDDGLGCAPADGTTCIHVTGESDFGFCTPACSGPGSCEQIVPGVYTECMIQKSGQWYCAFLCGGMGSSCPEWMQCTGFGMCAP